MATEVLAPTLVVSSPSLPRKSSSKRALKPKAIEALQPREREYEIGIGGAGLRLRVSPNGKKTFRYKAHHIHRVITIGPFSFAEQPGFVTYNQARDWVEKLQAARVSNTLPAVEEELKNTVFHAERVGPEVVGPAATTLADVAEKFYERRILPHRKRPKFARDILDLDIIPGLGARPITAITTPECATFIEGIVDGTGWRDGRPAKVQAGKVLALLKQLFKFAQGRGFTDRNPAYPLDPKDLGIETGVGDRWLTAEEIPLLWRALDSAPPTRVVKRKRIGSTKDQVYVQQVPGLEPATRIAIKLLLLTGVRSGELLLAKWSDVSFDEDRKKWEDSQVEPRPTWTIPIANQKLTKAQAKTGRPFVIPLPPTAVALFAELKEIGEKAAAKDGKDPSPWVIASVHSSSGGYTDKALGRAVHRMFEGSEPTLVLPGGQFSPHDLRRSMRTHLGKLRIPPHVTERALNHSLGRIVQTYDQGDYIDERREALERWDIYIAGLVSGKSKVVALPAAVGAR